MTDPQDKLHILQHSLGHDEFGRGGGHRNHFVTGPGGSDYQVCMALVADGCMVRRPGSALTGGEDCFIVTDAGKIFVRDNSPTPPKLSRSQQRYQQFLDADCGLTFAEWIGGCSRLERERERQRG